MIEDIIPVLTAYLAFKSGVTRDGDNDIPPEYQDSRGVPKTTLYEDSLAEQISYIVNVYIDGVLCIFGFVGNSLAIYVLGKDRKRYNSNSVFLQALAVFDILLLVFTVFYTVLRSIYPGTGELKDYYYGSPYIIAIVLPVGWIAQTGTIWFTLLVAGDRYLAITHPFKAAVFSTVSNARKITVSVTTAALLFNIPRFFHYYIMAFHLDSNVTFVGHIPVDTENWNGELYYYLYHVTLTLIFLYLVPLSLMVFCNHRLIRSLHRAQKSQRDMKVKQLTTKQSRVITLNLVIVITKFLLCQTPDFIAALCGAAQLDMTTDAYKIFATFKEMLLVFNSSVNFYIYLIFNSKFRQTLKMNCKCCACDKGPSRCCKRRSKDIGSGHEHMTLTSTNDLPALICNNDVVLTAYGKIGQVVVLPDKTKEKDQRFDVGDNYL